MVVEILDSELIGEPKELMDVLPPKPRLFWGRELKPPRVPVEIKYFEVSHLTCLSTTNFGAMVPFFILLLL